MRKFIGFENIIENFTKRSKKNALSHAHLISGDDGIGKSYLANILGKIILSGEINRDYVDIVNYKASKASFGVDDVRNIITEVSKKPFEGNKKIIIIHGGNKLTIQAQNALLKTIEEPPVGVYIIILCESLELILDTIKSRCEIYRLTPLNRYELKEYIKISDFNASDDEIDSAIAFSEGIPGRIERYFNDSRLKELRDLIIKLLKLVNQNNMEAIFEIEEKLIGYKDQKEEVLNLISLFIRDILVDKEVDNDNFIINGDRLKEIKDITTAISFKKLNNMIKNIEEARTNIRSNISWAMTLRVMLMGFMEG